VALDEERPVELGGTLVREFRLIVTRRHRHA
jgi:hypothetical protein